MDILDLKKRLSENPDEIASILEFYGYRKIRISSKEIRCARDDDGSGNSIKISLNDFLSSIDFVKGDKGDLFSIIMAHKKIKFVEVLEDIKEILGISNIIRKTKQQPFGGMFKKLSKEITLEDIKSYPIETLDLYEKCWNKRFYDDGISIKIQKEFKIGYDEKTSRITVPWFKPNGELCGIMGRLNYEPDEYNSKWFPVIAFSKTNVLYGYSENYQYLLEQDAIFIGESEKFVLQLATIGYRNSVALGGNNLSETQIKYIMETNPKKVYLCYDEGLDLEVIKRNLVKFKPFFKFKEFDLYLILDKFNKYLPKESKASPSDYGKEIFENLIKDCSKKINK